MPSQLVIVTGAIVRIGVEVSQLFSDLQTGLYHYTLNLLRAMAPQSESHSITLFTVAKHSTERWRAVARECHPMPLRLFCNPGRPYRLRLALDPISWQDVVFYITGYLSLPTPRRVNAYLVPDLTPLKDAAWHTESTRIHWRDYYDEIRQHADVVITFSEHTKAEVVEQLGIEAGKVHAIPLAAADCFRPLDDREQMTRELGELGLRPGGYILCAGTLEPRKNHVRLLRAYERLCEQGIASDQRLVLSGPRGWHYGAIFAEIERLRLQERVVHVGHFPRLELLMNGATLLAYPSLFEGFGLPPLEAMACGTPVVASNTTSLPEVVGNAGVLVDPHDEQAIADGLARVLTDSTLQQRMRQAGLAQARQFSWERTARQTLDVLERAAREHASTRRFSFATRLVRAGAALAKVS